MRKKHWSIIILLLIIASGSVYQLLWGRISNFDTVYYSPLYSTDIYFLAGDAQITQEFEAEYPGLSRIELYFENQANNNSNEVVFHLKQQCDAAEDIETFTVKQVSIVSKQAFPLTFSPLDDSAGRRYCIVVESKSDEVNSSLGVYASGVDTYPRGSATYKSNTIALPNSSAVALTNQIWLPIVQKTQPVVQHPFDIGFKLYYNGKTGATLQTLLRQLAAYKPGPLGQPMFYIFLLLLYGGLIAILWVVILKVQKN